MEEQAKDSAPVREGDIIAGKYRVERVLGIGGMGVVVAAQHVKLDQRVALKFLLPAAASHPDIVARFAREARAAAQIKCDHVARVLDVDTLPSGDPYMVMEFMEGEDLEKVLHRSGPLPVDVVVSYVLQACEALAEAHALGIVHRDLKPANLFLATRPNGEPIVKVLDFGISKSGGPSAQGVATTTSAIMGSPFYMSPEQLTAAKTVDVRSDVWAVGVVLYELLAGRPPFSAETMPELVGAILQNTPDALGTLRLDVPDGLAGAVHRCLEKQPANRFVNVAELAAAIAPWGPPRSAFSVDRINHVLGVTSGGTAVSQVIAASLSPTIGLPTSTAEPVSTHTEGSPSEGAPSTKSNRWAVVGAAGAAMALLAVGLAWKSSSITATVRAPPSSTTAIASSAPEPTGAPPPDEAPPRPTAVAPPRAVASATPVLSAPAKKHIAAVHAPSSASPAPPPAVPNCNPPFTIDATGHRVPKPECT